MAAITTAALSGCSPDHIVESNSGFNESQPLEAIDTTSPQPAASGKMPMGNMGGMSMPMPSSSDIVFKDSVKSNIEVPTGLDGLAFFDTEGKRVPLKQYLGKKHVVLVFTEGFSGGMLCPFCKTQTSRLVANYDKFAELDTEVLVVYPGTRERLDEFINAAKTTEKSEVDSIPFPLVLDEKLSAVGYFNIASNLAHPSTFIIDKRGDVRLAYVGADMSADRPSIKAMLGVIRDADDI